MRDQRKSRRWQIARGRLMMLAMLTALSGCGLMGISETERTICRELRSDLPSYSASDTQETLAAGARFIGVFNAVCSR